MFRSVVVLSVLVICLAFTIAHAQYVRGNLQGRVVDDGGNPLPDVNISVSGSDVQGIRGASTDARGFFRVLALPVGKVTVDISHIGHHAVKYENVEISLGKTTTLGEVTLTPKAIELSAVVVTSARPVIDPNSTTISANLSSEEFETLPTERDYLTITNLLPQANASFLGDDVNVAGATGQENAYYIDGMNTTDMYRAIGSTRLPYNFIREIEVKSGGYEAEYGRATGGIVNVITHSAGNDLEATAFGFLTDNRFAADRRHGFVELNTGDFSRYDAGFSVGGPLVRDRLWFFAAFNSRVEKEDITFEGLGVRTDRTTINTFAGKLTWQPQVNTNVMFTVLGDPTTRDRIATNSTFPFNPTELGNPDPFLGKSKQGGVSFSVRADHLVMNALQIEAAFSRYNAVQEAIAATAVGRNEPLLIDNTTGIWSGGYGEEFDRKSTRSAASLTGTYFFGEHTLKAGAQFEDNIFDEYWMNDNEAGAVLGTFVKNADNAFSAWPWFADFNVRNRAVSLFAQGSLLLHARLRINAGLRWEGQYLKGKESGFKHSITDQFQPRAGFVLNLGEIGTQKITGSFGRYSSSYLPAH